MDNRSASVLLARALFLVASCVPFAGEAATYTCPKASMEGQNPTFVGCQELSAAKSDQKIQVNTSEIKHPRSPLPVTTAFANAPNELKKWGTLSEYLRGKVNLNEADDLYLANAGWHWGGRTASCAVNALGDLHLTFRVRKNNALGNTRHLFVPKNSSSFCDT